MSQVKDEKAKDEPDRWSLLQDENARLRRALEVPAVWSEEERDGLSAAFTEASQRHGHYESLFAAASWLLRHRKEKATA